MATAARQQAATRTTEEPAQNLNAVLDATIEASARSRSIRNSAAQFLGVPPDKVCALLRNIWRPSKGEPELTDNEMFAGMSMIVRYGLDPVAKEVYVTRTSKGLVTIIGIDGFVKILDRTEGYDGFEQELGWSADGKDLLWVETRIYSKARSHPTAYRGFAQEYGRISGVVAKTIPWHMLRLFSLRHATRLFTPLGGTCVTEDEARWMDHYQPEPVVTTRTRQVVPPAVPTARQIDEPAQAAEEAAEAEGQAQASESESAQDPPPEPASGVDEPTHEARAAAMQAFDGRIEDSTTTEQLDDVESELLACPDLINADRDVLRRVALDRRMAIAATPTRRRGAR